MCQVYQSIGVFFLHCMHVVDSLQSVAKHHPAACLLSPAPSGTGGENESKSKEPCQLKDSLISEGKRKKKGDKEKETTQ